MPGPVSATSIVEQLGAELGRDPQLAAPLAHGLDRVLGEVEQDPEQLVGVGLDRSGRPAPRAASATPALAAVQGGAHLCRPARPASPGAARGAGGPVRA